MTPRSPPRRPGKNRLLEALPATVRHSLLERGEQVDLKLATVLCEPGAIISHVYFPIDSFVTLIAAAKSPDELESGLVGDEGMLGATLMLNVKVAPLRWLVQGAGSAWRIEAGQFLDELASSPLLRGSLERYLFVTLVQLAQTAACKRFHFIEARLARWLLMIRDRRHTSRFHTTHEDLAATLGVRRASITRAASTLQARKLIHYHRGDLQILDGRGLEAASCLCYAADSAIYASISGKLAGSKRSYSRLTTA